MVEGRAAGAVAEETQIIAPALSDYAPSLALIGVLVH